MYPISPDQLFMTITIHSDNVGVDVFFKKLSELLASMPFRRLQVIGWSIENLPLQLKRLRHILLSKPDRLHFNFGSLDGEAIKKIHQFMQYVYENEKTLQVPLITCECQQNEENWQITFLELAHPNRHLDEMALLSAALLQEHVCLLALSQLPADAAFMKNYFELTQLLQQEDLPIRQRADLLLTKILLTLYHVAMQLLYRSNSHADYLSIAVADIAALGATNLYPAFAKNSLKVCIVLANMYGQGGSLNKLHQALQLKTEEERQLITNKCANLLENQQTKRAWLNSMLQHLPWCTQFRPTAVVVDYENVTLSQREEMLAAKPKI
jgi:hypothetical protein